MIFYDFSSLYLKIILSHCATPVKSYQEEDMKGRYILGRCTYTGGEGRSHNNTDVAHIFWSDQNSAYLVVLRAGNHGNKSVPTIKMIVVVVQGVLT